MLNSSTATKPLSISKNFKNKIFINCIIEDKKVGEPLKFESPCILCIQTVITAGESIKTLMFQKTVGAS